VLANHHPAVPLLINPKTNGWMKNARDLPGIRYTSFPQNQAQAMNANTESKTAPKVFNGRINGRFAPGGLWKPWRLAGGYAQSVQQALSARSGGGLAAAWARSVQAGAAGEPGALLEGLRHARPERAENSSIPAASRR